MDVLILNFLSSIGSFMLSFFKEVGRITFFAFKGLLSIFYPPFYWKNIFRSFLECGYFSLPVVALTSFFSGGVIALQSFSGFSHYHAQNAIGAIVVMAIVRELGPVLAALMVAGRWGSAIAAKIGSMRISQQIDALKTLSTNPILYLVTPQLIAGIISLPFLVVFADILGISGGFIICTYKLHAAPELFINTAYHALASSDIIMGLTKAAIFGFIIALLGSYKGYYCQGGAEGVGRATTQSVVISSILVLIADYILTDLFFRFSFI